MLRNLVSRRPPRWVGLARTLDQLEARQLMATVPAAVAPLADPGAADPSGRNDVGEVLDESASAGVGQSGVISRRGRLAPAVVRVLNAEVDRFRAEHNLPSVAVGIWVPGSGRYLAVRGDTSLDGTRARGAGDPFRIASITKTFAATAVLQLADRGRIHLSDPIARYFPGFPNADRITVDDLLRMQSGIPDSLGPSLLAAYYANPNLRYPARAAIAAAAAHPEDFRAPGVETVYNNLNYVMLGEIIRQATGRSPGDQIARTILQPLGLSGTSYPTSDRLRGPLRGYSLDEATGQYVDKTELNPIVAGPSGAMVSTLRDLRVYAQALATGRLLRPATQQARLESSPIQGLPSFVQYGEGIEKFGQFVGHNGTIFGFSSEMYYLPALRATVVINVNRLDLDDQSQSTGLFLGLTRIAFPEYVNW